MNKNFKKVLSIFVSALMMLSLITPKATYAATNFTLNGWNRDNSNWTPGAIKGYAELDWVDLKIELSGYDGDPTSFVFELDYQNGDILGYTQVRNFYIYDGVGDVNPGSLGSGSAEYTEADTDVFTITYLGVVDGKRQYRVTFVDVDAFIALEDFSIYFQARLSDNAGEWPGASLHFGLLGSTMSVPMHRGSITILGNLTIKKVLLDVNNEVITPARSFNFKVTGPDGYVYNGTVTSGSSVTIENLPPGTYTVTEPGYADTYTVTITNDGIVVFDGKTPEKEVTITNKYVSPKVSITGTKVWVGGPAAKPDIQLQLFRNGVTFGDAVTLVYPTVTHTWNNLDKTDTNGVAYVYTVDEVNVPANYEKTRSNNNLTVTNTYKSPVIDITGTKVWVGGPSVRPTIQLQLYRNGVAYLSPRNIVHPATTTTWTGLDKTDGNGVNYVYTVDEVAVPTNYTKSISEDKLTVTNTYVIPKGDITGTKVWSGGPTAKPNIQLQLFRDGSAFGDPVTLVHPITFYKWENLNLTDGDGKAYVFTVDEVNVPAGYTKSISNDGLTVTNTFIIEKVDITGTKVWVGGPTAKPNIQLQLFRDGSAFGAPVTIIHPDTSYEWKDLDKTDNMGNLYVYTVDEVNVPTGYTKSISNDKLTITNTFVITKVDITGTKVWVGGPSEKPDVELQLFRDGVAFGSPVNLVYPIVSYEWKDLDATDGAGNAYVYTVDEVKVPDNYEKTRSEDKLTVTNTYKSPKIDIEGAKVWIGGPEAKPTIELQLFRDGIAFGEPVELVFPMVSYKWTGLDKTDGDGKAYVYTVDEVAVPDNYEKSISGDKLTVTNTYKSPKTEIIGTKVWVGGPLEKPVIKLQLFRDGIAFGDPVELTHPAVSYKWENLDVTDGDGEPYVYTVDEVAVPDNYEKSISEDKLTVTNTYKSPKIDIEGTKVWVNGPEVKPTIKLQLFRDGVAFGEPVDLVHPITSYIWEDLDKTDGDGKAYVYTIDEVETPPTYIKTISEDKLTVTNTYESPLIDISGEKTWVDNGGRPEKIIVALLRNGEEIDTREVMAGEDGKWMYSFNDIPEFNNMGVAYTYTIKELVVPGYVTIINGFDIVNTRIRGSIEFFKHDELHIGLAGALFGLYAPMDNGFENPIMTAESGADGKVTFSDVEFGSYRIKEISAPAGYVKSETVFNVSIANDGETVVPEPGMLVNEKIRGSVIIHKYDDEDNHLAGAVFVLKQDGVVKYRSTASEDPAILIISNVDFGVYTLEEESAPAGYMKDTMMREVNIDVDGEEVMFEVINKLIRGSIVLTKTGDNNQPLAGAEFTLYLDGVPVGASKVTDAEGKITFENIPYGTYTIKETKAPAGYVLTDVTKEVKVMTDGAAVPVAFTNTRIMAEVIILKVDMDTDEPLAGARFKIVDKDGVQVFEGATGTDGLLSVKLPFGQYIISETEAPEDYEMVDETFSVNITENGQIFRITVENEMIEIEDVSPLPQTGGIPSGLLYTLGALAIAGGAFMMRRKRA